MTVRELRKLLKGLPSDMDVIMEGDIDTFVGVCKQNSVVVELELMDEENDSEDTEKREVLLLVGCHCEEECDIEIGDINSQPELN